MSRAFKNMLGLLAGMTIIAVVAAFGITNFIQSAAAQNNPGMVASNTNNSNNSNFSNNSSTTNNTPTTSTTKPPVTTRPPLQSQPSQNRQRGGGGGRENFSRVQINWQNTADTLGISLDSLITRLNNGETLSQLANKQNVSINTLKEAMLSDYKNQLDTAVQTGRIGQQQADLLYQRVSNQLDQFMTKQISDGN